MQENKSQPNKLRVIVIEDNPGDYLLIEDYLMEKFQSIEIKQFLDFKSTSEFLDKYDIKCDLILLDLHLPDLNGIELINKMLSISSKIPIIILTGYVDIHHAKKSLELGVYDFLIKDEINPALLQKSIEFALSRSSYFRHIESQNAKLRNIAWTQSHVVRAPLARILSIMNLIEENYENNEDLLFWLKHLRTSTNEMDDVVRKIVNESQILNK
jgi:DNA-binding NtrC family response regulator